MESSADATWRLSRGLDEKGAVPIRFGTANEVSHGIERLTHRFALTAIHPNCLVAINEKSALSDLPGLIGETEGVADRSDSSPGTYHSLRRTSKDELADAAAGNVVRQASSLK